MDPRVLLLLSGDVELNPGPALGAVCATCGVKPRRGQAPLSCRKGCGRVCHKQTRCSGLSRWSRTADEWECTFCVQGSSASLGTCPSVVAGARTQAVDPVNRKCPSCNALIRRCTHRLVCVRCRHEYHNRCSGLIREEVSSWSASGRWTCPACVQPTPPATPVPQPVSAVADRRSAIRKVRRLRIIQWNVDGIKTSAVDLVSLLERREVDIVLVQETKLSSKDKTPCFPGYSCLRRDRPPGRSRAEGKGGVMTLVRDDIPFREVQGLAAGSSVADLETLSVEIRTGLGRLPFVVTNVYRPPVRSTGLDVPEGSAPDVLAVSSNHFIGGDFNCHSLVWDPFQPEDTWGGCLEQWMCENRMECLNDGSATRINRATLGKSVPDISLVHASRVGHSEWEVLDGLDSDHFPIFCELDLEVHRLAKCAGPLRWNWRNADWNAFEQSVEDALSGFDGVQATVTEKTNFLVGTILNAAKRHVGMIRVKGPSGYGESREVREAVRERNRLGRHLCTRRVEWLNACRRVRQLRLDDKRRRWSEFVEELGASTDSAKVWKTIRSLSGKCPKASNRNSVLVHKGREYRTDERKADAFTRAYAGISRLRFSREERSFVTSVRKRLTSVRTSVGGREGEESFTLSELYDAVRNMKSRGAEGADGVTPQMLKKLGPRAMGFMLELFNQSWAEGFCAQSWRTAIIVPILKPGKPADEIDSYRPISLTSCLGKVMERMVAGRLSFLAESRGWWSEDQAGFRQLRSAEEQVLRITQSVHDGFQCRPSNRAVLALLDFSKAYDTVWREKLLDVLLDTGVPPRLVLWVRGFLTNRMAGVRINGKVGRNIAFLQGLPQGSVLSPLLFLFYINNLRACVPRSLNVSLYADDVALWSVNPRKEVAATAVEAGVGAVVEWSAKNKLNLNLSKCEIGFFSNDSRESSWVPNVRVNGTSIPFNPTPTFLGVKYDRTLSFRPQAERISKKIVDGSRVLGALSGQEWGWDTHLLRRVYSAASLCRANYCGAGWQPWLSQTSVALLDRAQNKCLRKVTGVYATAPVEALRREAGIPSFNTIIRQNAAIAWERSVRVPDSNPRRQICFSDVRHRTVRGSWRKLAMENVGLAGLQDLPRRELKMSNTAPWLSSHNAWVVNTRLAGGSTRNMEVSRKLADAMDTIRSPRGTVPIYRLYRRVGGGWCA